MYDDGVMTYYDRAIDGNRAMDNGWGWRKDGWGLNWWQWLSYNEWWVMKWGWSDGVMMTMKFKNRWYSSDVWWWMIDK